MYLCSSGHEEICFDNKKCPLCEKIEELATIEADYENFKDELKDGGQYV
jgi:hypothetical protein